MRRWFAAALFIIIVIFVALSASGFGQAPPAPDPGKPYVMEYYYKVHWGHQEEFLELFKKNHLPVLREEIRAGRMLSVRIDTPAFHMPEQERWDYRVTIVFKDAQAAYTPADEKAIQRKLFADLDTFKHEEQRRFELLEAHWDLAISQVALETSKVALETK